MFCRLLVYTPRWLLMCLRLIVYLQQLFATLNLFFICCILYLMLIYSLYSSLVVDVFQTYSLSSSVICDPQLVVHLLYHLSDVDVLQTYSLYSSLVVDVFLDLQSFYTVVNLFICCIIYCIIWLFHLSYHLIVSSIVSSSYYQT